MGGSVAAIPIIVSNLLIPLTTERCRLTQGFINIMYAPMVPFQLGAVYFLHIVTFWDLPKMYMTVFGMMLSVPCFVVWAFCIMCSSRYGRQDMALVERQRVGRARE